MLSGLHSGLGRLNRRRSPGHGWYALLTMPNTDKIAVQRFRFFS